MAANWKSVAEGVLEGLHVPHVHVGTFNLNPQASNIDLAFYDAVGGHVRWGMPMFGPEEARQLRATPEDQWQPMRHIGCIWYIFPGLLLSHELYGMIYADLSPGQTRRPVLLPLRLAVASGRTTRRHADP